MVPLNPPQAFETHHCPFYLLMLPRLALSSSPSLPLLFGWTGGLDHFFFDRAFIFLVPSRPMDGYLRLRCLTCRHVVPVLFFPLAGLIPCYLSESRHLLFPPPFPSRVFWPLFLHFFFPPCVSSFIVLPSSQGSSLRAVDVERASFRLSPLLQATSVPFMSVPFSPLILTRHVNKPVADKTRGPLLFFFFANSFFPVPKAAGIPVPAVRCQAKSRGSPSPHRVICVPFLSSSVALKVKALPLTPPRFLVSFFSSPHYGNC